MATASKTKKHKKNSAHLHPTQKKMPAGQLKLEKALREAINECIAGQKNVAVSFSGGIDSSFIAWMAKQTGVHVIGLGVGMKGSHDSIHARHAADALGIELQWKELTPAEIKKIYEKIPTILHTHDYLQCSIGTVNYAISQFARAQKCGILLSGTGADELFCGYGEFEKARGNEKMAEEMREKRMHEMEKQNLQRENTIGKLFEIEQRNPYMHPAVVQAAISIPSCKNLEGKYGHLRKSVLRETAIQMGLPESIAVRPKKAMQYGSGVEKEIRKFSRTT